MKRKPKTQSQGQLQLVLQGVLENLLLCYATRSCTGILGKDTHVENHHHRPASESPEKWTLLNLALTPSLKQVVIMVASRFQTLRQGSSMTVATSLHGLRGMLSGPETHNECQITASCTPPLPNETKRETLKLLNVHHNEVRGLRVCSTPNHIKSSVF